MTFYPTQLTVSCSVYVMSMKSLKNCFLHVFSAALLKSARDGQGDIEGLCIACPRTDCTVMAPHPYFMGGLCEHCEVLSLVIHNA